MRQLFNVRQQEEEDEAEGGRGGGGFITTGLVQPLLERRSLFTAALAMDVGLYPKFVCVCVCFGGGKFIVSKGGQEPLQDRPGYNPFGGGMHNKEEEEFNSRPIQHAPTGRRRRRRISSFYQQTESAAGTRGGVY